MKEIFVRNFVDVCDFKVFYSYRDRDYNLNKGNMFGFNYLLYNKNSPLDKLGLEHSFAAIEFLSDSKKSKGLIQSSRICENYGKSVILLTFEYEKVERVHEINDIFCNKISNVQNHGQDTMESKNSPQKNISFREFFVHFIEKVKMQELVVKRLKNISSIF